MHRFHLPASRASSLRDAKRGPRPHTHRPSPCSLGSRFRWNDNSCCARRTHPRARRRSGHADAGTRRHRHARADAGSGHTRWRVGDRPADHRAARLQHFGRGAVGGPRHPRQPVRRRRRCGQRVRARHQLRSGAGADRRHADQRSVRSRRAVQLRRRYAGRCRADRDHPRTDGGAVRLGRHRRSHQPDHAQGPRTGLPLSPAIWPAAIRRRCAAS